MKSGKIVKSGSSTPVNDNEFATKKYVDDNGGGGGGGIPDAPEDGKQYGREDGEWTEIEPGGIQEAPRDGKTYGRNNALWKEVVNTPGDDGSTFTPVPTVTGNTLNLSWTNNGGLPNPTPVSVVAPKGDTGADGTDGVNGINGRDGTNGTNGTNGTDGEDGATFTPLGTVSGNSLSVSWTNNKGLPNPTPVSLVAPEGEQGPKGDPGTNGRDGTNGANGTDGADATINGVNTLIIEEGTNITLEQVGNTLTINSSGGGGGIPDAPIDGNVYGRSDESWVAITDTRVIEKGLFSIQISDWVSESGVYTYTYVVDDVVDILNKRVTVYFSIDTVLNNSTNIAVETTLNSIKFYAKDLPESTMIVDSVLFSEIGVI